MTLLSVSIVKSVTGQVTDGANLVLAYVALVSRGSNAT